MVNGLTVIDKAIAVLQKTNDGNDLDPIDLALVEVAVNGHLEAKGIKVFEKLYESVEGGTYKRPWFHGQENMLIDHEGYVYWKKEKIEHFTPHWRSLRMPGNTLLNLADGVRYLKIRG
jgi:hypothetical protein